MHTISSIGFSLYLIGFSKKKRRDGGIIANNFSFSRSTELIGTDGKRYLFDK